MGSRKTACCPSRGQCSLDGCGTPSVIDAESCGRNGEAGKGLGDVCGLWGKTARRGEVRGQLPQRTTGGQELEYSLVLSASS